VALERQRLVQRRVTPAAPDVAPDLVPSQPPRRSARRTAAKTALPRERRITDPYPHVLSEELFRGRLTRHRQHVDRTDRPLVVMFVTLNRRDLTLASALWTRTVQAVATVIRDTDILGWFEPGAVLGVILTDVEAFDDHRRRELERRLRRTLGVRLDPGSAATLSIGFHVVHTHAAGLNSGIPAAEPLLLHGGNERRMSVYAAIKRGLDIIGSVTLLAACAPLFVVIAAAVKASSPGPVFFRQVRVGQHMRRFTILKFRTMTATADHAIHHDFVSRFIHGDVRGGQASDSSGLFKIADDPRVTGVGRLLRRTSLDELPQLWNVLRGEMSLVGPRPPIPYEVRQYKSWHCRRVLDAKPGITGLWQVTGRSRTTFDEMVRLDIRYARTCSFSTDLKILLATPKAVIGGRGAY
jgi:lipopolysaccharide/colanic/teichoic acid biosynthesis glycosyltransferase